MMRCLHRNAVEFGTVVLYHLYLFRQRVHIYDRYCQLHDDVPHSLFHVTSVNKFKVMEVWMV